VEYQNSDEARPRVQALYSHAGYAVLGIVQSGFKARQLNRLQHLVIGWCWFPKGLAPVFFRYWDGAFFVGEKGQPPFV